MRIEGKCHCGNIRFTLDWPGEADTIKARACGCSFCVKHGGVWTSHRDAALEATVDDASLVSRYRFGTATADFHVCTRCGVSPFVTSTIDDKVYAVVNVNTFEGIAPSSITQSPSSFEGEETGERLERRKRNWIGTVRVPGAQRDDASVRLVEYDPAWPSMFAAERALLERILRPWLAGPIEHIGSTAVPGLVAKPVIDIMAAVQTLEASRPAIEAVATLGYVHYPYRPEVMHWFCKPSAAFRTHHLHLVPLASPPWRERIAFRDRLRESPAVAAEYADLKRRLAREFEFDREAYTDAKAGFVRRVTQDPLSIHTGGLP